PRRRKLPGSFAQYHCTASWSLVRGPRHGFSPPLPRSRPARPNPNKTSLSLRQKAPQQGSRCRLVLPHPSFLTPSSAPPRSHVLLLRRSPPEPRLGNPSARPQSRLRFPRCCPRSAKVSSRLYWKWWS
uniref:Uncharacterized protein n=1 Tax=Aegilops tauschii subsp. strangulata TaxID=200361 RepID=A0A453FVS1_AEGTS